MMGDGRNLRVLFPAREDAGDIVATATKNKLI